MNFTLMLIRNGKISNMSSKSKITWYVLETDKGYLKRDFRHTHGFTHSLYDAEKFTLNSEYEHGVRVVCVQN